MARPWKQEIVLSELGRKTMCWLTRSRITPHSVVRRAERVLASADEETSTSLGRRVAVSMLTVGRWRPRLLGGTSAEILNKRQFVTAVEEVTKSFCDVTKKMPKLGGLSRSRADPPLERSVHFRIERIVQFGTNQV